METIESKDTSSALLRAARDVLLDGGLPGFSMRRVAGHCGVSATAIYRHFDDKDALLAAAVLEGFRTFGSYLMDALEKTSPRARFRHLARRYFDFALEHKADYRLIFLSDCEQQGLTALDETARREIGGTFQLLQDRIVDCQNDGLFKKTDSRALAACVWASVHGMATLLLNGNLGESDKELEKLIKLQIDLIETSLLA